MNSYWKIIWMLIYRVFQRSSALLKDVGR
jgi:hypothetical protein